MSADNLDRLLRAAAHAPEEPAPDAPFGFDTRVVASWRAGQGSATDLVDLTRFLRRTGVIAFAVLVLASAAAYRQFSEDAAFSAPQTNEYAIADSAIQMEFSQ
ncbi:MAG TPA: hypothetical protein VF626_03150 [Chthoniobacterales bacterium]|jgi:hypothetical protein